MSGVKWTPGPWRLDNDCVSTEIVPSDGGDIVCDAPEYAEDSMKRWRHNAILIAASPDLYNLLDQYVEAFSDKTRGCNLEKVARSALAKARGES